MPPGRPHVLGIDDGPFEKGQHEAVPVVAVLMEGASLVESVVVGAFPVDGDDATGYLVRFVAGMRAYPALQAVVLGGITIAGLGLVDVRALAERIERPVLVVTRRDTADSRLDAALRAAGLPDRLSIVARAPRARRLANGLFLASAGVDSGVAEQLLRATLGKAQLPEPLRVAHLVATALVRGESRGRV